MKDANTHKFKVAKISLRDAGKGRVRIKYCRRDNAKRFQVVRIVTDKGRQAHAVSLGHNKATDRIEMDLDLRTMLDLISGDCAKLEITKASICGTLWWYLTVRDPLIRVPAWLACISIALGILSIVLALK